MPRVDVFSGEKPAISARLLDDAQATLSKNCLLTNGDLRPLPGPLAIPVQPALVAGATSLYKYGAHWFSWAGRVDAVSSPLRLDPYDRVYFTGDGVPKYTRNDIATGAGVKPAASYRLGVPAPDSAPGVTYSAPTETEPDPLDDETRFYLVTYVTGAGEESAPSPVSDKVVLALPLTDSVTLTLPLPAVNEQNITHKRIYRTATGGATAGFFLVDTVPVAANSYEDDKGEGELGELLATEGFLPPPEDMHSLVKLQGGFLVGASGMTVVVSEAYLPYAYKRINQQVANARIVAIAAVTGGAVIGTDGYPELLSGYSPESVSLSKLDVEQACVSARSMVSMGATALYASPDGLVQVGPSGAILITEGVIEPEQWRDFVPSSIHAYQHEGQYIGFYDAGATKGGFVFDPARRDLNFLDVHADAGYRDLATDKLFLLIGGVLHVWREGEPLTLYWRSKEYKTPPSAYPLFRVKVFPGESVAGTKVRVYTEHGLLSETTLASDWGYLPPVLATSWQIEVESKARIEALILADSFEEMAV